MGQLVFRVWAAAKRGGELIAQGEHYTLVSALANARALAETAVVAIETPESKWHTFDETGTETLGPLDGRAPTAPPVELAEGSERRRSRRFSTSGMKGEAVSHLSDGTPVRVLDVSIEGVQLQLPARCRLRSGDDISLRIRGHRGFVDVTGRIAWVKRRRCGVEFDWQETASFAKTFIKGMIADVEYALKRASTKG